MQWIGFEGESPFMSFRAIQGDAYLSSHLATSGEIDHAATELKRQIDITAKRMKLKLQKQTADPLDRPET